MLAPQLEKRLGRFEEMSNRIEQRIRAAEETVIERMRTEAPKVLEAYTQQKIARIQREAERIQLSPPRKQGRMNKQPNWPPTSAMAMP